MFTRLPISRAVSASPAAAEKILLPGDGGWDYLSVDAEARRLYITEVQAEVEGDVHMPPIDESAWRETRREDHPAGPDDQYPFVFRVLERI